jgi:signal transduction histidine kinase
MDRARHQPGNGLGLSIVTAIASLHSGRLVLENAHPGLRASILLAAADPGQAAHSSEAGAPSWVPALHS